MNRIHGPVIILYMLEYIQVHSHIVFAFSFEECHLVELANPFYTVYLYKQINALNEGVNCVIMQVFNSKYNSMLYTSPHTYGHTLRQIAISHVIFFLLTTKWNELFAKQHFTQFIWSMFEMEKFDRNFTSTFHNQTMRHITFMWFRGLRCCIRTAFQNE